MPTFRTRNTATDYETALTNCSYCSVDSIINKTSDEVRQDSGGENRGVNITRYYMPVNHDSLSV